MKPNVLLLGPELTAVSGVSTHILQILASPLSREFSVRHFQVGSEGRDQNTFGWFYAIARIISEPCSLFVKIIRTRADIVHVNTSLVPKAVWRDAAYCVIGKILRRKVILQVHGGSSKQLSASYPISAWIYSFVVGLPDVVIVLSSKEVRAHDRMRLRKLLLIPNAIDVEAGLLGARQKCSHHGSVRMVFLGRLHRDKGLFEAIEAAQSLRARGINQFVFDIAGTGPDRKELEQRIRKYRLEGHVRLVGVVAGPSKRSFLSDADILVLPSHHEGLPYTLLEAMAAGVPVVATDVGAIPDVVQSGVHGILIPPRDNCALTDALATLMSDPARLERMSRACRERIVAEYRVERLINQVRDIYRELSGGQSHRPPDTLTKLTSEEG